MTKNNKKSQRKAIEGENEKDKNNRKKEELPLSMATKLERLKRNKAAFVVSRSEKKKLPNVDKEEGKDNDVNDNQINQLEKIIPGYTAPLQLDTSSLDPHRPKNGLSDLRRRANQNDDKVAPFVMGTVENTKQTQKMLSSSISSSAVSGAVAAATTTTAKKPMVGGVATTTAVAAAAAAAAAASFKQGHKKRVRANATRVSDGWFNMASTPITNEIQKDLILLKNRNYLDPKRFYKKSDMTTLLSRGNNPLLQVGTIIEGPSEYYSSRLTKKQRRNNLTEEVMADPSVAAYTKKKYQSIHEQQQKQSQLRKKLYSVKPKRKSRGRR